MKLYLFLKCSFHFKYLWKLVAWRRSRTDIFAGSITRKLAKEMKNAIKFPREGKHGTYAVRKSNKFLTANTKWADHDSNLTERFQQGRKRKSVQTPMNPNLVNYHVNSILRNQTNSYNIPKSGE